METLVAEQERALGHCTLRTMATGYTFNLERCPQSAQNREYLVVAATYFFRDNVRRSQVFLHKYFCGNIARQRLAGCSVAANRESRLPACARARVR